MILRAVRQRERAPALEVGVGGEAEDLGLAAARVVLFDEGSEVVLGPALLRRGLDHIGVVEDGQRAKVLGQAVDLAVLADEGVDQAGEVVVLAAPGLGQGGVRSSSTLLGMSW